MMMTFRLWKVVSSLTLEMLEFILEVNQMDAPRKP